MSPRDLEMSGGQEASRSPRAVRDAAEQNIREDNANLPPYQSHIMTYPELLGVFGVLVGLTALTVLFSVYDLGSWEIWISLSIASLKASLVAAYFMHLRYDQPFNTFLIIGAIVFLAVFLSFTLADTTAGTGVGGLFREKLDAPLALRELNL